MPIRVRVFRRAGRQHFEAQWTDPVTGRKKTRTTENASRKDALKVAGKLEAELNAGTFREPVNTLWKDFRKQYEESVYPGLAKRTRDKTTATFRAVESIISPARLKSLDTAQILRFQSSLRSRGLAEFTVKGHLSELRKLLRWAVRVGMLDAAPHVEMPKRVCGMKGRPITGEEFDRMLAAIPKVVPAGAVASWEFLLRGLWWSGLRLGEAMTLHWTDDAALCVDLIGRRPMFRIRAQSEKGRKDRVLPMAPEFAELLARVPDRARFGFVFDPMPQREPFDARLTAGWVSRVIGEFGEKAGVKVSDRGRARRKSKEPPKGVKYASSHDLRRAFGFRWSMRVLPPVLMELMRHESIQTTMEFYVGRNAEVAADTIWNAVANPSANSAVAEPVENIEK